MVMGTQADKPTAAEQDRVAGRVTAEGADGKTVEKAGSETNGVDGHVDGNIPATQPAKADNDNGRPDKGTDAVNQTPTETSPADHNQGQASRDEMANENEHVGEDEDEEDEDADSEAENSDDIYEGNNGYATDWGAAAKEADRLEEAAKGTAEHPGATFMDVDQATGDKPKEKSRSSKKEGGKKEGTRKSSRHSQKPDRYTPDN